MEQYVNPPTIRRFFQRGVCVKQIRKPGLDGDFAVARFGAQRRLGSLNADIGRKSKSDSRFPPVARVVGANVKSTLVYSYHFGCI